MRVYVQFSPKPVETPIAGIVRNKVRVSLALEEAFAFVSHWAKDAGYRWMLFDSVSPKLISFFERFGFKPAKDFYEVLLHE